VNVSLTLAVNISVPGGHRGGAAAGQHLSALPAAAGGGLQGREQPLDGAVPRHQGRAEDHQAGVSASPPVLPCQVPGVLCCLDCTICILVLFSRFVLHYYYYYYYYYYYHIFFYYYTFLLL